jgi:hypothetical protein
MNGTSDAPQKIDFQSTHDYREDYANSVNLRVTLWDFALAFGRIDQTGPQSLTIKQFTSIYISPQQAKALHQVLGQNLDSYEKNFGPITIAQIAQPGIAGKPQ